MAKIQTDFTGLAEGKFLRVERHETFSFDVSGIFAGRVVIERSINGGLSWDIIKAITEVLSGNLEAAVSASGFAWYRFRCDQFVSGTIGTCIADVVDDVPGKTFFDNKSDPVLKIQDGKVVALKDFETRGALSIASLNENQVVHAGPDGVLIGNTKLQYDGSQLSLIGNINLTGDQNVTGNSRIIGDTFIDGGMKLKVTAVSASYTILKNDTLVFIDTTSADAILTLPAIIADAVDDGRMFRIHKSVDSANKLTIAAQGSSKINSEATDIIAGLKNDNLTMLAQGGNWFAINRDTAAFGAVTLETPGAIQNLTLSPVRLSVFDTDRFKTPGICVVNVATDAINIEHIESVSMGGDGYRLGFRFEISNFSNNQEIFAQILVDGVETNIEDVRATSNQFNTVVEAEGLYQVPDPNSLVELVISASTTGNATFENASLIIERLSK